jgi:hypothetical protein
MAVRSVFNNIIFLSGFCASIGCVQTSILNTTTHDDLFDVTGQQRSCQVDGLPVDVSSADVVVGDGTAESCTEEALRSALETGGTIRCDCGDTPPTITLSSPLIVSRDSILGCGGITLSGGGSSRIFEKPAIWAPEATPVHFTLQHVTLTDGHSNESGGAVWNDFNGSFTAVNVRFQNNSAAATGPDVGGGAVYSLGQSEVVFVNCQFINNTSSNGGALGGIGTSYAIYNGLFESNQATGSGGGTDAGPTGQGGIGGAIYIDGVHLNGVNSHLRICGSQFRRNQSNAHGGGIFTFFYEGTGSTSHIDQSVFEENAEAAASGGGMYHQNGALSVVNSTIIKNSAGSQGGGIWIHSSNASFLNCTFEGNYVTGEWGLGGALTVTAAEARVVNCTFANNATRHFANAIKNSGTLYLANSLLYNNNPSDGPNVNIWAGVGIDKSTDLTDGGGNLQFPSVYSTEHGPHTDDWLLENPGVLRDDPILRELAENGGPTPTMAIGGDSLAVDQGTETECPDFDQRGQTRVAACDIGAFEYISDHAP